MNSWFSDAEIFPNEFGPENAHKTFSGPADPSQLSV